MTRFTRRAQIREAARMAWVLTECLAVVITTVCTIIACLA